MNKFSDTYPFWVAKMQDSSDLQGKPISITLFFWQKGKASKKQNFLLDIQKIEDLNSIPSDKLPTNAQINKACKQIREICEDYPLYVFADLGLKDFLEEKNFIDFLWMSKAVFPFLSSHTLLSLAERFGVKAKIVKEDKNHLSLLAGLVINTLDYIQEKFPPELCRYMGEIGSEAKIAGTELFKQMSDFLISHSVLSNFSLQKYQKDVNYFEHIVEEEKSVTLEKIFKKGGVLSKKFNQYQARKPQVQMAKNVLNAFKKKQILLAEAGTGTGKSLAYLAPSLMYARSSGRQVVVSTNTINLQKQLMNKDVPLLMGSLPISFRVALLKGRVNYLCLQKFNQIKSDNFELGQKEMAQLFLILPWAWFTATGDISYHSGFSSNLRVWGRVCSDPNFCLKRKCSYFKDCFLYKARAQATKSDVAIINHSLLLTELLNQMPTLNQAECVVVDEAHNLHSVALSYLGPQISYYQVSKFLDSIYSNKSRFQKGFIALLKSKMTASKISTEDKKVVEKTVKSLTKKVKENGSVQELYKELFAFFSEKGSYGRLRIKKPLCEFELQVLVKDLQTIFSDLNFLANFLEQQDNALFVDYDIVYDHLKKIKENAQSYLSFFSSLLKPDWENYCLWLNGGEKFYSLCINYTPIQIGEKLKEIFYDRVDSLVFCSATIALREKFKFFKSRMGLDLIENQERIKKQTVDSPFDYKKQSKVFVPKGLQQPETELGREEILGNILAVLKENQVGCLILFTSLFDVKKARDFLLNKLKGRLILAQDGSKSRESLLEEFSKEKTSVLLAASSFWEGVDVSGHALQLLILYKLPFAVPSDPLVEASLEFLQKQGKNSFMHYMLPMALLKYKQGFGRLIRSQEDYGVLISYDNRIFTKKYGNYFSLILPTDTSFIEHQNLPCKVKDVLLEQAK